MDAKKAQLNARIPSDLLKDVRATAKRKGLTLAEYVERALAAEVESEKLAERPGFLEAWEKFLFQYRAKK